MWIPCNKSGVTDFLSFLSYFGCCCIAILDRHCFLLLFKQKEFSGFPLLSFDKKICRVHKTFVFLYPKLPKIDEDQVAMYESEILF